MRTMVIKSIYGLMAISLLSVPLLIMRDRFVQAQTSGGCTGGFSMQVGTGTTTGSVVNVSGPTPIMLTSPSSSVNKVIFKAGTIALGRAQKTNELSWSMPWITGLMPTNTTHQLSAEVWNTGTTAPCMINGPQVYITNSSQANLGVQVNPNKWEGPMSFGFPVVAQPKVINPDFDPTPYSLYNWTTTIGNVTVANQNAQYFSGQTEGTGTITVRVSYGGKEAIATVPITVKASNTPLPEPTANTNPSTTTTDTNTTTQTSIESPVRIATLQNNPVAQDCVVAAIGLERFTAINSGSARPTFEEIQKFNACFANSNYILPSNFAPVIPTGIKELVRGTNVTINNLKNDVKTKDDKSIDVLVFSGKAKPNSLVLIYVFSDPLVLTTTANDNGEWTYTLEDPIEPGNHEVYSVVDRGDGTYERSDAFTFGIATVEAAEANPSGLSLRLADEPTPTQSNRGLLLYAVSSAGIVAIVVIGLIIIMRRKRHVLDQPQAATPPTSEVASPLTTEQSPTSPPDNKTE